MDVRIQKWLSGFAVNDISNIAKAIDELRLLLVRLSYRNRLKEEKDIPIVYVNDYSTASGKDDFSSKWYRIDNQGRKFYWQKKTKDLLKEFSSKIKRKRPTHRGKRKKDPDIVATLSRSITTFSQLMPSATIIPQKMFELISLLLEVNHYMEFMEDLIKEFDPGERLDLQWSYDQWFRANKPEF